MKKKRTVLVFLVIFGFVFLILSIGTYAFDYIASMPDFASSDPSDAQDTVDDEAESTSTEQSLTEVVIRSQGAQEGITPKDYDGSTHPYNTWNSPYSRGVDGYNYTDPQHYADTNTP